MYQSLIADGTGYNTDQGKINNPVDEPETVKTGTPPGGINKMMTKAKAGALKGGLDP